ncbi:MAG: DUF975 family protein [Saprospiraceae bacterium]|nr:DUF975 family protein [Saprospiraceae bacterium]
MTTENTVLMSMARDSLRGKWGIAIGTFLLYSIIMGAFGAMRAAGVIALIIAGPMMLGAAIFSLNISRDHELKVEQIFQGFNNFSTALVTYLLMVLYIFLWSLLLIIPGIIAALSYSMSFYILSEEPELKASEVLQRSKEMMDGYKLKLFGLYMLFLLLGIACIFTLGIGFLWLIPFAQVTTAKFYEDIKAASLEDVNLFSEEEIV